MSEFARKDFIGQNKKNGLFRNKYDHGKEVMN